MNKAPQRLTGFISDWGAKGFGFIEYDGVNGPTSVFAHITSFVSRFPLPQQGQQVSFLIGHDTNNKLRAVAVQYIQENSHDHDRKKHQHV